jgi:Tfp pilus assembly protein PilF
LAQAHLARKNLPQARRWALAAQKQDPKQPLAAYVLARIQLSIGDSEAALKLLETSLDEEQPQEDLLTLLAAMKLQAGPLEEAERLHLLGRKHFQASDRWLKGLARIYLQAADTGKLPEVLESLAELEPDSRLIRKKLAALALEKGDFVSARRWAEELTHLDLQDAEAHAQLATAARGAKDLALAAEEYETAVKLEPAKTDWRFGWATVLGELGKKEEARQVAEELEQQDADHPGLDALLEKLKRE